MTLQTQAVNRSVTYGTHTVHKLQCRSVRSKWILGRELFVPVKPRREPPPQWTAYGYDDHGKSIPIHLGFVRSPNGPELALHVDDDPTYIRLSEASLYKLIENLRLAGQKWVEIQRLSREPGRWQ